MDQQNDTMRERLLARMPQPENIAAYREETDALLARHEKALSWEKHGSTMCYVIAGVMVALWLLKLTPAPAMRQYFWPMVGAIYFLGAIADLRYRIYRNRVETLKELKQVQLQLLEVQASLQKRNGE